MRICIDLFFRNVHKNCVGRLVDKFSACFRMVPTSVEKLREGQGVLERVLRGNIKMERILKRSEGGASEPGNRDKDIGMK